MLILLKVSNWFTLESLAASGNGVVHVNSTEEKNQIALGSNSETGDGRIWIRNRNEDILISLKYTREIWFDKHQQNRQSTFSVFRCRPFGQCSFKSLKQSGRFYGVIGDRRDCR